MAIKTDLKKLDALTDKEIARQIAEDPEVAPDLSKIRLSRVRGQQVLPTKKSITIRLSDEVIQHFKKDGRGWQTRMNDFLLQKIQEE